MMHGIMKIQNYVLNEEKQFRKNFKTWKRIMYGE